VGVRAVEAHRDPAGRAQIGRAVIAIRVHFDQHRLFFGARRLDDDHGFAVAVMIVPEIGEEAAALDMKAGRAMRRALCRTRQRERQFADARNGHGGIWAHRRIHSDRMRG
jgi:hypothetical protein